MTAAPPPVSIVMPVHGRADLTEACLQHLIANTDDDRYELVVVDNASRDETPSLLARLDGAVRTVRNERNEGFAIACNQGAWAASGEHVVFLNNDTEPGPGWLEPLVAPLADGEADVVGSLLTYPNGAVQHAGISWVRLPSTGDIHPLHIPGPCGGDPALIEQRRPVSAVTGACLAIRREVFLDLNGFCERYRNGYEDVDLCARVAGLGGVILYEPASRVVHHESGTGDERFVAESANRELFRTRWSHRLAPDVIATPDAEAALVRSLAAVG
ncbi:MAG: glycosyltransferase family 2 protein [Actinomycetota bacterium]